MYSATVPESLLVRLDGLPDPDDELLDLAYLPGPFFADIAAEFFQPLEHGIDKFLRHTVSCWQKIRRGPCERNASYTRCF